MIKYTVQIVHAGSCASENTADTSRAGARVCPNGHGSWRKIHLLKIEAGDPYYLVLAKKRIIGVYNRKYYEFEGGEQ